MLLLRDRGSDQRTPIPASGRMVQTARIVVPAMGASGSRVVEFSGTVTGLQRGETLWIILKRPAGQLYYPAAGPCSVDGDQWTCGKVDLDKPGGYMAFPLLANEEGTLRMAALVPARATWSALDPVDRLPGGTWQWGPEVLFAAR
ncbi:hypothetical protein ACQPXM_14505 [Kribbella sp. CA-253562]|uniref:hypothetical protein n=1 Tax=Kribbella sp. CA-253562 TaxID=3239942 RepID=UPI003D8DEC1C